MDCKHYSTGLQLNYEIQHDFISEFENVHEETYEPFSRTEFDEIIQKIYEGRKSLSSPNESLQVRNLKRTLNCQNIHLKAHFFIINM